MADDFEKLDERLMRAFENARHEQIPQKDLVSFQEGVMKRIVSRQIQPASGIPIFAMALTAVLSAAVILGAVIYLHQSGKPAVIPVPANQASIGQEKTGGSASVISESVNKNKISQTSVIKKSISQPAAAVTAALKDEDIVEEIQALKEIGAWNEDDEEDAGIPVEVTYADIDLALENSSQPIAPTSAIQ